MYLGPGVSYLYYLVTSAVDSFSYPEVLAVLAKCKLPEIRIHPCSELPIPGVLSTPLNEEQNIQIWDITLVIWLLSFQARVQN